MSASKKILVLVHQNDAAFFYFRYLIKPLIKEWESRGLTVEVVRGIDHFVPADVVIPHLDMTIVPREYEDFLNQYPVVVNRHVMDISKSRISTNLIGKDDAYSGPVIVKTDFNSGGLPEKRLHTRMYVAHALLAKVSDKLMSSADRTPANQIAWGQIKYLRSSDYPVFASLSDVPEGVFDNENLIVEKFLPEVAGDKYCVRYCFFFGDKEVHKVFRSKEKVVKGVDELQNEEEPIPPELQAIRQRLRMDYGKLDYVVRDGKVILLDVNRTPACPPRHQGDLSKAIAHQLADGICSKLN